eukprot:756335-Hanusia_phi.AAC.3
MSLIVLTGYVVFGSWGKLLISILFIAETFGWVVDTSGLISPSLPPHVIVSCRRELTSSIRQCPGEDESPTTVFQDWARQDFMVLSAVLFLPTGRPEPAHRPFLQLPHAEHEKIELCSIQCSPSRDCTLLMNLLVMVTVCFGSQFCSGTCRGCPTSALLASFLPSCCSLVRGDEGRGKRRREERREKSSRAEQSSGGERGEERRGDSCCGHWTVGEYSSESEVLQ